MCTRGVVGSIYYVLYYMVYQLNYLASSLVTGLVKLLLTLGYGTVLEVQSCNNLLCILMGKENARYIGDSGHDYGK